MTARLVTLLAVLACVQMAAVTLLYWPKPQPGPATADTPLVSLDRDTVARIGITDADGDSLSLVRRSDRWMTQRDGLPVDASRVERLFRALSEPAGFPAARSDEARDRFEVATDRFQRRLALAGDDTAGSETVIYLGTSPGLRRVHARRDDATAIHTIALSTFDVPVSVDAWLDPSLLSLEGLEGFTIAGTEWRRMAGEWRPVGTAAKADPTPVDALEQVLNTLQVSGVAPEADPAGAPEQELLTFSVMHSQGTTTMRLDPGPGGDGKPARLYSSRFERWFTLSGYDRDRLSDALSGLTAPAADH